MSYAVETPQMSAQFINASFVRKIDEGRTKEAEVEGSNFLRMKMRQDSFARELLPPKEVREDQLDRDVDSDQPRVIVEKEPDSKATFVPFKGTGELTWFKGPRYPVYFGKVESQRFNKSKFELMTYSNDIRKILSDNSVKDMADEEDRKYISTIDGCITAAGDSVVDVSVDGESHLDNYAVKKMAQKLFSRKKPAGKMLMSHNTFYSILDLAQEQVGFNILEDRFKNGIEGVKSLWGMPVVTTIKRDIVADGKVYMITPENWHGQFFLLQDATLYIKQEADIITFWSYSAPGIGVGANDSVVTATVLY